MAIVQFVAADHKASNAILADKDPDIRVFEIGKTPPATIEAALAVFKAGFTLDSLKVYVQ